MLDAEPGFPVGYAVTLSLGFRNLLNKYPEENPLAVDGTGNRFGRFWPFGFNGGYYYASINYRVGQVAMGAARLLQDDGPEQIDEAEGVVEPLDAFLVPRHVAAALAEDLEELVVESLGLALLVGGVGPITGEVDSPRSDLIP